MSPPPPLICIVKTLRGDMAQVIDKEVLPKVRKHRITNFFTNLFQMGYDIVHGSIGTKVSCLLMGFGQIFQGQIIKGLLYFGIEVLFVLFMVFFGGSYLGTFLFSGHLGTTEMRNELVDGILEPVPGDDSQLILLYGIASLVVIILFVTLWVTNIKGCIENDRIIENGGRPRSFKEDLKRFFNEKLYITLLTPPLIGILVFTILPLIFMILIAFTNYDYQHIPPTHLFDWVGFDTFVTLFTSTGTSSFAMVFLRVLIWTFCWAFIATFSNYFLGMIVALMINKKGIKLKALWRSLFVAVIAIPNFVTLLLMSKILDGDGILNTVLGTNILWLGDTRYASLLPRIVIILVNIWIGIPYTILMVSGLLMNIPDEMFEAAKLDGAGPFQLFIRIVLPYMLHATGPYLITQFIGNLNNFNVIWLLTGGGPGDNILYGEANAKSTDLLVTWLFRMTTGDNPKYNVASVIGIIVFIISAAFALFTYRRSNSQKNEEDYQ